MKKLLKDYNLNNNSEYFEMIVESVINGNRTQAKEQFKVMPKQQKREFLAGIFENWIFGLEQKDRLMFLNLI